MRMRTFVASITVSTLCVTPALSAQYIRANEAGYFPEARKNLVVMSDEEISDQDWSIVDLGGKTVLNGKIGASKIGVSDYSPKNFNYQVDFSSLGNTGDFTFRVGSSEKKIRVDSNPYGHVITSSIRFLRSMRSGTTETVDRAPAHMGDSASTIFRRIDNSKNEWENWKEDANGTTTNLQGGWYAGGNYGKFTSAIAYTTYYLLKAYETNPALFEKVNSKSSLNDVLDEAKFGLTYLMKIMPNDNDFIIQVGGFDSENGTRLPDEDLFEGKRVCYSAFTHTDMGFAIAALALGAKVFEEQGSADASKYKTMALKMYDKAISGNYEPTWLQKDYEQFKDDTRYDNLLLGTMELHRLTGDEKYQTKGEEFSKKAKAAYWGGWNMQNMMSHSLLAKTYAPAKNFLVEDLEHFAGMGRDPKNIWGFPMEPAFSGFYIGLGIGVGAARYESVFGDKKYEDLVLNVLDYGFGRNNWGVSFTASPKLPNSVKNFNLPIYKLQKKKFPEGAVALGPCDRAGHDGESKWILDDVRVNYCYPFNSSKIVFLDHADDYMTMDSWIYGVADNIYFLALASTMFGKK